MTKKEKTTAKKKDVAEEDSIREIKVRVVGVGGGGGSIISGISSDLKRVLFAAANTDLRALEEVTKRKKIKGFNFGKKVTGGLGTGMNVELGEKAAKEEYEEIKELFRGQDIVILVVSLGGGAGSGALPVFAAAAREMGVITYGFFTLPFLFEGEKKMKIAKSAIKKAMPHLNAVTILPNEKIFEIVDKNTPLKKALSVMNENLAQDLEGLVETIYETGLINIDFADVRAVLENRKGARKLTYLNTIEANLEEGSQEIVRKAVSNSLYSYDISSSRGVLFNITGGKDIGLADISAIAENIAHYTDGKAKIIVGIIQKQRYRDKIKIVLLATGCGEEYLQKEIGVEGEKRKPEKKKVEKPKKASPKKKSNKRKKTSKKEKTDKEKKIVISYDKNIIPPEKQKKPQSQEEEEIIKEEEKWDEPTFLRRINDDD